MVAQDSGFIFKKAFKAIDGGFLNLQVDKEIDLKKIKPFLELARKNAMGEDSKRELDALKNVNLNSKEVEFLANVTTEVARTQHFSETLAKHKKDILKTIVRNRIKKMKASGLSYNEINNALKYNYKNLKWNTNKHYALKYEKLIDNILLFYVGDFAIVGQ